MSNIPCQTDNQRIQTLLPLLSALFIQPEEAREKNREQSTAKTSYLKQEGCYLKPSQYCYQGSAAPSARKPEHSAGQQEQFYFQGAAYNSTMAQALLTPQQYQQPAIPTSFLFKARNASLLPSILEL